MFSIKAKKQLWNFGIRSSVKNVILDDFTPSGLGSDSRRVFFCGSAYETLVNLIF
jgi:hypothetical protein